MIDEEERAALVRPRSAELAGLVRRRIIAGAWQPGSRLPPSRQLALESGVSRVTLASAVKTLQAEGYLISRSGPAGGVFVSDLRVPATCWVLAMCRDPRQLDDILDHRLAVETQVAVLAAQRRDEDDLVRLRRATQMVRGADWRTKYQAVHWVFHEAVAKASKSPRLQAAGRRARGEMWSPSYWLDCEDQAFHVMPAHRAIYEAIQDHDSTKAAVAMMADLESTRVVLRSLAKHEALLKEDIQAAICVADKHQEVLEVFASHIKRTLTFRFAKGHLSVCQ